MTRPADPSFSVRTWATTANHPAGASSWNNQPTKVEHPSPAAGFQPGQGNAAEYLNKLFNDAFAQDQSAKNAITTLSTYTGQMPILNWNLPSTFASGLRSAVYNVPKRCWELVGDDAIHSRSFDWGQTWSATDLSGVAAGENCIALDYNDAGVWAIATAHQFVFHNSSGSPVKVTVHPAGSGLTTVEGACIAYDPIHQLWVAALSYHDGASAKQLSLYTSADLITWTARTAPAQFTSDQSGRMQMAVNRATGTIVWVKHHGDGSELRVSTSTDGGITWSAAVTVNHLNYTYSNFQVAFNAETSSWMIATGISGKGSIWRSTNNGASWTEVATFELYRPQAIAPYGAAWITSYFDLSYTLDEGVTWLYSGTQFVEGVKFIGAGAGGFLAVTDTKAYTSIRAGKPALGSPP